MHDSAHQWKCTFYIASCDYGRNMFARTLTQSSTNTAYFTHDSKPKSSNSVENSKTSNRFQTSLDIGGVDQPITTKTKHYERVLDIDAFDTSMDVDDLTHVHSHIKPTSTAAVNNYSHASHGRGHGHRTGHDGMHAVAINGGSGYMQGTIQPFSRPQQGILTRLLAELRSVLREHHARRIVTLGIVGATCILILLLWCQSTNSIALTAFTYLILFDVLSLGTCLITIWVSKQKPSSVYSYGYERFEVLAVFSSTMLAIFGAIFIMKESTERVLRPPDVHTGRLMLGAALGLISHLVLLYGSRNQAFRHVSTASKSSWLQEHFADICRSFCTIVPGFDHILLPRINPFVLIGLSSAVALCITDFLVDINNYHVADPLAAFCIAMMTIGTMFPMSVYSGTILLQTTPSHILGQLDKCLREASTLDGVLEFRNEHFWTLSFGQLAGSLNVRVRRDADEQMVLAHVFNKLSHLVSTLTIQIIKDEWTRINPVSATIGTKNTSLQDFTASLSSPGYQSKTIVPGLSGYTPSSSLYSGAPNAALTPARAHSTPYGTPYGTPMRDLSFHSNIDGIPSDSLPLPSLPDQKLKGILRTNTNSIYGVPRPAPQYTVAQSASRHVPSAPTGSTIVDFSTLGSTSAFSTNNVMSPNSRTSFRR